jgi:glutaredoxin
VPKKKRASVVPVALAATVVVAAGAFYVMARGGQHDEAAGATPHTTLSASPPSASPAADTDPRAAAPLPQGKAPAELDEAPDWTQGASDAADADAPTASRDGAAKDVARAGDAGPTEAQIRVALRSVPVTVYTRPASPECVRTREFLTSNGIVHVERDIQGSDEASEALAAINPSKSVPTFDIDGRIVAGLHEQAVLDAVAASLEKRKGMRVVFKVRPQ